MISAEWYGVQLLKPVLYHHNHCTKKVLFTALCLLLSFIHPSKKRETSLGRLCPNIHSFCVIISECQKLMAPSKNRDFGPPPGFGPISIGRVDSGMID